MLVINGKMNIQKNEDWNNLICIWIDRWIDIMRERERDREREKHHCEHEKKGRR